VADEANRIACFIEASARIGEVECHDRSLSIPRSAGPQVANLRSCRHPSLPRLSDSMPSVAKERLRPIVDFRRELTRDFRREVTRLHVWFGFQVLVKVGAFSFFAAVV
jgi:hypothetical protein